MVRRRNGGVKERRLRWLPGVLKGWPGVLLSCGANSFDVRQASRRYLGRQAYRQEKAGGRQVG